jgi:hypothetical protein
LLEECFCFGEGGAVAHGGDYFTRLDPDKQTRRLVAQLERLGHVVALQEAAA